MKSQNYKQGHRGFQISKNKFNRLLKDISKEELHEKNVFNTNIRTTNNVNGLFKDAITLKITYGLNKVWFNFNGFRYIKKVTTTTEDGAMTGYMNKETKKSNTQESYMRFKLDKNNTHNCE